MVHLTIDYTFIFDGLFSKHSEVCNLVKAIYQVIDESRVKLFELEWKVNNEEIELFIYDKS